MKTLQTTLALSLAGIAFLAFLLIRITENGFGYIFFGAN